MTNHKSEKELSDAFAAFTLAQVCALKIVASVTTVWLAANRPLSEARAKISSVKQDPEQLLIGYIKHDPHERMLFNKHRDMMLQVMEFTINETISTAEKLYQENPSLEGAMPYPIFPKPSLDDWFST